MKFEIEKSVKIKINGQIFNPRACKISFENLPPIFTPCFMPVGTKGTVKAITVPQLLQEKTQIILGNTYHLLLRPGEKKLREYGGLHKFMNWPKAILTDSGGFQVMSLAKLRKIDEDGIDFRSHINGDLFRLDPKICMRMQNAIGSNFQMVLDECPSYNSSEEYIDKAIERSVNWSIACKEEFEKIKITDQFIFGINQGGVNIDKRLAHLKKMKEIDFDGFALGGLAVGESKEELFHVIENVINDFPINKPRYLMGVGKPTDLIKSAIYGVDMFDCVLPTRSGRHAQAFYKNGAFNISRSENFDKNYPIDEESECFVTSQYKISYLHHLFKSNEILGQILLSIHNISFFQKLMADLRLAIVNEDFSVFQKEYKDLLEDEIELISSK